MEGVRIFETLREFDSIRLFDWGSKPRIFKGFSHRLPAISAILEPVLFVLSRRLGPVTPMRQRWQQSTLNFQNASLTLRSLLNY